ncbi:MAG: hypothetical protein HYS39_01150 [Proteobacteria bacterium]|nr:hypothetical protein [Pseudomonadota bacterium]
MFLSLLLAYPLFMTYLETGLVPRLPTAILCSGIALIAAICVTCGFILHSLSLSRQVVKRLHYLSIPTFIEKNDSLSYVIKKFNLK